MKQTIRERPQGAFEPVEYGRKQCHRGHHDDEHREEATADHRDVHDPDDFSVDEHKTYRVDHYAHHNQRQAPKPVEFQSSLCGRTHSSSSVLKAPWSS